MRKIVKAFEVGREEGRAAADTIRQSLVRDFIDEREFDYGAVTTRKAISHFTRFIAQISADRADRRRQAQDPGTEWGRWKEWRAEKWSEKSGQKKWSENGNPST